MDRIIDMPALGRRLAGKRAERDLTQQALAEKAGLTQRTIALLERGRKPGMTLETVVKLAQTLDVCLLELVYGRRGERHEA